MNRLKTGIAVIVLTFVMTDGVSAECIDVPVTRLVRDAEILLLARLDAVRGNPVDPKAPEIINGTVVNVTVKTLWKGSTPRQIELRQTLEVHEPQFWGNVGKDFVLSVRRLTPERPLRFVQPLVTAGFTAQSCGWRLAESVNLSALGRGRSPND